LGLGEVLGNGRGEGEGEEEEEGDFSRGLDDLARYAKSLPSPIPPLAPELEADESLWRYRGGGMEDGGLTLKGLPTTTSLPIHHPPIPNFTNPSDDLRRSTRSRSSTANSNGHGTGVSESDAYISLDDSGVDADDMTTDEEDGGYDFRAGKQTRRTRYAGSAVVELRPSWADGEEEVLQLNEKGGAGKIKRKGVFDKSDESVLDAEVPSSEWKSFFSMREMVKAGEGADHLVLVRVDTTHIIVARSTTSVLVPGLLRRTIPTLAFGLVVLDISNCQLVEIPYAIASCHTLKELDIKGNPLASAALPSFLGQLTSLKVLIADNCNISTLPSSLSTLRYLHTLSLRFNNLRFLPGWLSRLSALDLLLVDGNDFPPQWANLVQPILIKHHQQVESPETESSPAQFATYSARSSLSAIMPTVTESPTGSPGAAFPIGSPAFPSGSPAFSMNRSSGGYSTNSAPVQSLHRTDSNGSSMQAEEGGGFIYPGSNQSTSSLLPAQSTLASPSSHSFSLPPPASSPHLDIAEAQAQARQRHSSERPATVHSSPNPSTSSNPIDATKKWGKMFKKVSIKQMRPGAVSESARTFSSPSTPAESSAAESKASSSIFRSRVMSRAPKLTPAPLSVQAPDRRLSRLSKRQSFLKLEKVPALEMMIGNSSSPTIYTHDNVDQKSALRSVMAYLRDLDDLTNETEKPADPPTPPQPSLRASPSLGSLRPGPAAVVTSPPIRRAQSSRRLPAQSSRADSHYGDDQQSGRTTPIANNVGLPLPPSSKLRADPAKRQAVVDEILSTEKTYLRGLQELCAIYIVAASVPVSSSTGKKDTVVPAIERRAVFGNVEAIRDFHESVFLPDLENAIADSPLVPSATPDESAAERVARVFIRHAAFLKIYSSYVNAFDSALARLQTWTVNDLTRARSNSTASRGGSVTSSPQLGFTPRIGAFDPSAPAASTLSTNQKKRIKSYLKRCRTNPRHSQISLESYLLLPVQRVPRYRMLLETLLTCTPVSDDVDPALLEPSPVVLEALDLISAVATDMNERKRESEGRTQLLQWQHRIGNTFRSPLVQPHRSLLRSGNFTLVRTVKRSTTFLETSNTRPTVPSPYTPVTDVLPVHSLVTESNSQKLIALLCSDIIVFIKEPADPSDQIGPVDLYTVLRLTNSGPDKPPPVTLFGSDNMLRVVCDTRAIIYLQCERKTEALSWANAINLQSSLN
ncbi:hypothetical protein P7C70_g3239, partial [Phenoliferia sp. Uapishka_3]